MVAVVGDRVGYAGPAAGFGGDLPPAAPDRLLLPGLVDLHCHGGAGGGFPDDDLPAVRTAAAHHRHHGTTTLVASLVSAPPAHLHERLDLLRPLVQAGELAGVHLEGPFLAQARCGAQDPAALLPGDPRLLDELLAGGGVVSVTLAPETAHADELVEVCRAHGVLPSFGHTDATAARTTEALRSATATGRVSATHLFNGMPPMLSRAPGPVAACLAAAGRGELVVELVADGVHLAPETVAMVFDLVGPAQVALVSDAMAAAGMPDGDYRLGALPVTVRDRVARLTTGGAVAGGTARLVDVLRSTVSAGVPLADAVRAATRTPADLLGRTDVGRLVPGARADVLVTDPELVPVAVLAAGVPLEV
ncbi:N-acetylglucosamine-6-phosphate deacetylase [Klenkia taihuensis]|uniref:N-acetylglucosamine-6-phosphate deacetylase n=1 Tax=Klenkia taihuensis TaxID=1225127 RepID=A0A1I1GBB3_9ACTN|nr:amidohydrolase family protein [Klenkia taihuensis]GHE09841.1 N-acetylglucosamine-6-phosphate deacetylase [Klenkia taihuensis]SFC09007.1 N-acetylglucosamine-6-phosphate deacetylase [Klenkia taihuensis]